MAVVIQLILIGIAAVTAFYFSSTGSPWLESKIYGFPCYCAGSVFLSIGTGLCSFIIEKNTVEWHWQIKGKERPEPSSVIDKRYPNGSYPRLVWLQQDQTVNDQAFNGYVILAGAKRRILNSRRIDDMKDIIKSDRPNPPNTHFSDNAAIRKAMRAVISLASDKTSQKPEKVCWNS